MDVNLAVPNPGFQDLLENPNELLVVDANFYLPPNRTNIGARQAYLFDDYKKIWVEPMHKRFPNLAIHEAVLEELVEDGPARFANECLTAPVPPMLRLLRDTDLTETEEAVRATKEQWIARYTNYDPVRDNKQDRGEVKSLAHMGTVGYTYFSSNDAKALRLVEEAERLGTSLDDLRTIHFYEGIYYLHKMGDIGRDAARNLYRYHYHLTRREKSRNPSWDTFCSEMYNLYGI